MSKKTLFIINPVAGRRMYRRYLADIIRVFSADGHTVTVYTTEKKGDAAECAAQSGAEYDRIVCMGGDGTLNEMINGYIRADLHAPIGYIPAGSTNDFAVSLGLTEDILEAADDIVQGRERVVDAVKFGDCCFVNIANFGVFSSMSYNTPQNLKNTLGSLAYVMGGIQDLSNLKTARLRVSDSEHVSEAEYAFGAICNVTSMGGAFSLPDGAEKPDDGYFEVLLVKRPETIQQLHTVVLGLLGGEYNSPCIEFFKSDNLMIEPEESMAWALDGERVEISAPTRVKMLPGRLRFLSGEVE